MPNSKLYTKTLRAPLLTSLLLLCSNILAESPNLAVAQTALMQGQVDRAASELKTILSEAPGDSQGHQLLCRVFYAQDLAEPAVRECEAAVSTAPSVSDNYMWLGRAYGLKASHSNPLSAMSLAKKVRDSFEYAVAIDPENVQACSDLGEFYASAPGFVGGGLDKAIQLANRMQPRFPAEAHRLRALISGKHNDSKTQEAEFKSAVNTSHSSASYIDLASFYAEHGEPDLTLINVKASIAANHTHNASLVDAASILTTAKRDSDLAERCLREYLGSSAKSDEAPAFKVHVQLGDLLKQRGNLAAARAEYVAALTLASKYSPALNALKSL